MKARNRLCEWSSLDSHTISCRLGKNPGSCPMSTASNARESSSESRWSTQSSSTPINDLRSSCHVVLSMSSMFVKPLSNPLGSNSLKWYLILSFSTVSTDMSALQICVAQSICQSNGWHITRKMNGSCELNKLRPTIRWRRIMESLQTKETAAVPGNLICSVMLMKWDKYHPPFPPTTTIYR